MAGEFLDNPGEMELTLRRANKLTEELDSLPSVGSNLSRSCFGFFRKEGIYFAVPFAFMGAFIGLAIWLPSLSKALGVEGLMKDLTDSMGLKSDLMPKMLVTYLLIGADVLLSLIIGKGLSWGVDFFADFVGKASSPFDDDIILNSDSSSPFLSPRGSTEQL